MMLPRRHFLHLAATSASLPIFPQRAKKWGEVIQTANIKAE